MELIKEFVAYLASKESNASKATVKNYRADVGQFIKWFQNEFNKTFDPRDTTPQIINIYKNSRSLSPRSLERHLSSLNRFFKFLAKQKIMPKNPFDEINLSLKRTIHQNQWLLTEFKNYLYLDRAATLTIKNYTVDIRQFLAWIEKEKGINKEVFSKITPILVAEYKYYLLTPILLGGMGLTPTTVNRKLSSLRKYFAWAQKQNLIDSNPVVKNEKIIPLNQAYFNKQFPSHEPQTIESQPPNYSRFPPKRLLQKTIQSIIFLFDNIITIPLANLVEQGKDILWTLKGKPVFQTTRLDKRQDHTIPKWYKKYHQYSIVHYLHFAILIILVSGIGMAGYNKFFSQSPDTDILSANIASTRIISLKGRLTDSFDIPIVSINTPLRVGIYNDPTATNSALLWQEALFVNPDKDGVFETTLGKNTPLPQNIFFLHPYLWLGVSVGQKAELVPRQPVPTSSYAASSQTLQGLLPISDSSAGTKNVVLALDSSGNLNIGESSSPVFQAVGGQLTLSGKILLLSTVTGSSANILINPDSLGKIDLQKPLQNTSENNNISTAIGALEVNDLLAVLATSSGQSAFTINQDSTGPIISASASGTAKFTVENSGNIVSATGTNWLPTIDSQNSLNIASASGMPFITFDTLGLRTGIGNLYPEKTLDVLGSFRVTGDITISNFDIEGGILYASTSGQITQIEKGASAQCLLGGSTPHFGNCVSYDNITESGNSIGIGTSSPKSQLDVTRPLSLGAIGKALVIFDQIENQDIFTASSSGTTRFRLTNSGNIAINTTNTSNPITIGTDATNGNGAYLTAGGIWTNASGRQMKENFVALDPQEMLDKINQLSVLKWNYRLEDPAIKHIGPIAEDFYSLFGVGNDNKHISSIDPAGLALIGIQGLSLQIASISAIVKDINLTTTADLDIVSSIENQNAISNSILNTYYLIHDTSKQLIERIGAFSELIVANLKAGFIKADEITTKSISITTESINVAGVNLKTYIEEVASNVTIEQLSNRTIISPIVKGDLVQTNIISPLASDSLRIHLGGVNSSTSEVGTESGKLIVENASGSAVATIDSFGNASFSGTLASADLNVDKDATIGGTLTAGKIVADSIEGLEAKVSTLAANYIQNTKNNSEYSENSENQDVSESDTLSVSFGAFTHGLMSFGPTSLAETSIAGTLYLGNSLTLASNSINVAGADLELQSLRQGGISFLSGLIFIDKDGNLKVEGGAEFAKDVIVGQKLSVNLISPIPDSDLVIKLGHQLGHHDSSFIIQEASGSAIFTVNQKGDLVASGSGTFYKLNLNLVQKAIAVSQTEIIATGSAGLAAIQANQKELTIKNNIVTDKSIIYISPVGTPSGQMPFLIRQTPEEPAPSGVEGSFTVGIQSPNKQDTFFNWLIVN